MRLLTNIYVHVYEYHENKMQHDLHHSGCAYCRHQHSLQLDPFQYVLMIRVRGSLRLIQVSITISSIESKN